MIILRGCVQSLPQMLKLKLLTCSLCIMRRVALNKRKEDIGTEWIRRSNGGDQLHLSLHSQGATHSYSHFKGTD
jgi:hypothetical protein